MKIKLKRVFMKLAQDCYTMFGNHFIALYAFGSSTYNEFIKGCSDLDFLVVVDREITEEDFQKSVVLRNNYKNIDYFKYLEGCFVSEDNLSQTKETNSIYWGSKNEKIKQGFLIKTFTLQNLIDKGQLIFGENIKSQFPQPDKNEMLQAIEHMIETVKTFGADTKNIKYTLDWVFLLSQSFYYLKTGNVTSKIKAAEWVNKNMYNSKNATLKYFIKCRKKFNKIRDEDVKKIKNSVEFILTYNFVVENELNNFKKVGI